MNFFLPSPSFPPKLNYNLINDKINFKPFNLIIFNHILISILSLNFYFHFIDINIIIKFLFSYIDIYIIMKFLYKTVVWQFLLLG
jgi:hypothetical protein